MIYTGGIIPYEEPWNELDIYEIDTSIDADIRSIAINNNGDVYGCSITVGGIYKKDYGSSTFNVILSGENLKKIIATVNNDIYAIGYNGVLLKQTNSTGDFEQQVLNATVIDFNIVDIISFNNDVYITGEPYTDYEDGDKEYPASVYKQTNSTGMFNLVFDGIAGTESYLSSDSVGNIFVTDSYANKIFKKPFSSSTFILHASSIDTFKPFCIGNDLYLITYSSGDFYLTKQTNQTGSFVNIFTSHSVSFLDFNSDNDLYIWCSDGGLYKQYNRTGDFVIQFADYLNTFKIGYNNELYFAKYITSTSSEIYTLTI